MSVYEYFNREFKMLKDYRAMWGYNPANAVLTMKEHKIKGATELAVAMNLITAEEVEQIRRNVLGD